MEPDARGRSNGEPRRTLARGLPVVALAVALVMLLPSLSTTVGVDASLPGRDATGDSLDSPLATPSGYNGHRPLMEFFTGLSCPSCMAGPHQDLEALYASIASDEKVPWTYVAFHELNGGGVDGLTTNESVDRMRYYQPGVSGTPDAEFDGGWSELGGMYRKPTVDKANAQSAISSATTRYEPHLNPRQPIRGLITNFKYVNLDVEQYYQDGEWAVVVNVTYLGMGRVLLNRDLSASLTVFMVEDNVIAFSKVEGSDVLNHDVFRGYALQNQPVTLKSGETQTYAGSWKIPNITVDPSGDYPKGTPVPIKPQDVVAVAAVFDSDDLDSSDGVNGNPNQVPRCVQSATPNSTAYDRGNKADPVGDVKLTQQKGGVEVSAYIGDPDGASTAAVFWSTEAGNSTNWSASTMSLAGKEVCDPSGVCYAYSDATATATIDPKGASKVWLVVLYTDGKGALGRTDAVPYDIGLVAPKPTKVAVTSTMLAAIVILVLFLILLVYEASRAKNPSSRRAIAAMTVVVLVIGGAILGSGVAGGSSGSKVPDIGFTDLDGKSASLADFRGKVVLLDMMATWCPDCRAAMKDLKTVSKQYGSRIVMLTVDIDPKENSKQLAAFKQEYGATWRFTMDNKGQEFMKDFSVNFIPRIIVVDVRGRATLSHEGALPAKDLSAAIDKASTGGASLVSIGSASTSSIGLMLWAVGVGALTFVSPCSFPMLPGYVTYYLQLEDSKNHRKAIKAGLAAASGIVLLYMVVALLVGIFGSTISAYIYLLQPIVALLLITMAVVILLDMQLNFGFLSFPVKKGLAFSRRAVRGLFKGDKGIPAAGSAPGTALDQAAEEGGYVGLFYYGLGYGAASAGCMAPVVIALIFLAVAQGSFLGALAIFLIFALTMAALMVVITMSVGMYGGRISDKLRVNARAVRYLSGALLVFVGVWMMYYFLSGLA